MAVNSRLLYLSPHSTNAIILNSLSRSSLLQMHPAGNSALVAEGRSILIEMEILHERVGACELEAESWFVVSLAIDAWTEVGVKSAFVGRTNGTEPE